LTGKTSPRLKFSYALKQIKKEVVQLDYCFILFILCVFADFFQNLGRCQTHGFWFLKAEVPNHGYIYP